MLQMAHTGIYVVDIERMTEFYKKVFQMHVICEKVFQDDELTKDLLKGISGGLLITKLITDQGKALGAGEMLELLQVVGEQSASLSGSIYQPSSMHIAFRVDDLDVVVNRILKCGGMRYTDIHIMSNGNRCCFARDIEGNWLELIERH